MQSTRTPTISLCMIVKNEENHLAHCLKSVRSLVDEMVIVDTGSQDRTVEIARDFGARIYFFSWIDDFSAARNESLRHATGEWIFYLDADERLNCMGEEDCLRRAASIPGIDAYSAVIRNYGAHQEKIDFDTTYNIRLFRNYPGIHFVNEVHERVEPFLAQVQAHVVRSGFVIEHFAFNGEQKETEERLQRNLSLSLKHLDREPDDAYGLYYLGFTLMSLKRYGESLEILKKALRAADAPLYLRTMILNLIAYLHLTRGEYVEALSKSHSSLALIPNQNTAHLLSGLAHFQQERYEEALHHLVQVYQSLGLHPEKRQSELSQELDIIDKLDLIKALGICYAQTNQYGEAIPLFQLYLASGGQEADILRRLGICHLNIQDFEPAVRILKQAEERGIGIETLAIPMAYALARTGNLKGAEEYVGRLKPQTPEDFQAVAELEHLIKTSDRSATVCRNHPRPVVSLCMIVKNEEKHLAACLESVRSLVDEIVIVDTGSQDRTIDIAQSRGARVYPFTWNDDFAAARNESLRHVSGEWVIFLDADERLNCMGREDCLRKASAVRGVDAYSVPIRNHNTDADESDFNVAYATRMFRRHPDIHFEGRVHETVEFSLQRNSAVIVRAAFFIEHLGYDIDGPDMERKYTRNLTLLQGGLREDPENPYLLYHTGLTLLGLKREDECRNTLLRALHHEDLNPCLRAMTLNMLSYCDVRNGKYAVALKEAAESLTLAPVQNTARLLCGLAHYHLGDYNNALPYLLQAHEFTCLPPEKRQTSIHCEDSIEKQELLKAIAICYSETKQFQQAAAFLRELLDLKGDDADLAKRLGICCLNTQDYSSAIRYLRRAEELGAARLGLSLPMAFACFQVQDFEEAHNYFIMSEPANQEDLSISMTLLGLMASQAEYSSTFLGTWRRKRAMMRHASQEQAVKLAETLATNAHTKPLLELLHELNFSRTAAEPFLMKMTAAYLERNHATGLCTLLAELLRGHEGNPVILNALAIARIKAGDFQGAVDAHLVLHELLPHDQEIARRLAGLYAKMGNVESVLAHLSKKREAASQ